MRDKKTLYKLSVISAVLIAIHYYQIDKECFLGYLGFSFILMLLPLMWNRWLYHELIEDAKRPISYDSFILIGNIVYLLLCIFFFVMLLYGYKPDGYRAGVC